MDFSTASYSSLDTSSIGIVQVIIIISTENKVSFLIIALCIHHHTAIASKPPAAAGSLLARQLDHRVARDKRTAGRPQWPGLSHYESQSPTRKTVPGYCRRCLTRSPATRSRAWVPRPASDCRLRPWLTRSLGGLMILTSPRWATPTRDFERGCSGPGPSAQSRTLKLKARPAGLQSPTSQDFLPRGSGCKCQWTASPALSRPAGRAFSSTN